MSSFTLPCRTISTNLSTSFAVIFDNTYRNDDPSNVFVGRCQVKQTDLSCKNFPLLIWQIIFIAVNALIITRSNYL
jgi:hypothetical protein